MATKSCAWCGKVMRESKVTCTVCGKSYHMGCIDKHKCAARNGERRPINRPCSACSAGDYEMKHHLHYPPFADESAPAAETPRCVHGCGRKVPLQGLQCGECTRTPVSHGQLGGAAGQEAGDKICTNCHRANPVWFAPNELWNRVIPERSGVLCPYCFIARAERQGVSPTAWVLDIESVASRSTPAAQTLESFLREMVINRAFKFLPDHKRAEELLHSLSATGETPKHGAGCAKVECMSDQPCDCGAEPSERTLDEERAEQLLIALAERISQAVMLNECGLGTSKLGADPAIQQALAWLAARGKERHK